MNQNLYIDLGTANTLIYAQGHGLLLNEPSMLATRKSLSTQSGVVAIGMEAKKMLGKTPQQLTVLKPLRQGVVADTDRTAEMMRCFATRIKACGWWRKPNLLISLPCVVTKVEREAVQAIGRSLGARKIRLIEEPMAAAIGAGLPVFDPVASMVVDIGGGTTEIAILSCGGIVHAQAVRVGGNDMDESIIHYLRNKYQLAIGEQTAERVKIAYGRICLPETAMPDYRFDVSGRDLVSGLPVTRQISVNDLSEAIECTVCDIIAAIKAALCNAPPEIVDDIYRQSIVLTGGGALLKQLAARLQHEVKIPALVTSQPLLVTALGGFRAMLQGDILERIGI